MAKKTAKVETAAPVEEKKIETAEMINDLVEKADKALEEYMKLDQEQIDKITKAMALAGLSVPAISLNAFQVLMHSTPEHMNARLLKIDNERIELSNEDVDRIFFFNERFF